MEKTLFLYSVILICGLAGVNSLQCYVCNNCTNPTDDDLKTCGEPVTSAPPITVTSAATTVTSAATTASSGATTASSVATTASSVATTASSVATTASSAATTVSSAPTTVFSNTNTSSSETTPSRGGTRSKRSVLSPFSNSKSDGCNCRNEADCECDDLFSNRIAQYADEVQYVCYKVVEQDGIVYRGCGPATWLDGKDLCESEIAANVSSCNTCDTDKCNGSFTMQYSTFMLIAAIGIMMFK